MKTIPITTITVTLAALFAMRAHAIETPADDAPPPPIAGAIPADNDAKPEVKAETAYLGVVSSEIPEMLAAHIGVKQGEGIVVRAVMPDSPAAKAGIANYDVITRVAGQAVGSSEDLTKQVTAHKPGETVHLNLIHEGKATEADVTLGERPAQFADIDARPLDPLNLDGIPKELADRVRDMIQGNLGGLQMQFGPNGGIADDPQINEAMRDMKLRMENAMKGLKAPDLQMKGGIDIQQGATIRMLDGDGSIELKSSDGGKEVTIRDKDNKITWTGPWDTEQDKAAAPDDVRERVERLNLDTTFKGNGLRLRMRPVPDNDGE
jgi:serine protease Do